MIILELAVTRCISVDCFAYSPLCKIWRKVWGSSSFLRRGHQWEWSVNVHSNEKQNMYSNLLLQLHAKWTARKTEGYGKEKTIRVPKLCSSGFIFLYSYCGHSLVTAEERQEHTVWNHRRHFRSFFGGLMCALDKRLFTFAIRSVYNIVIVFKSRIWPILDDWTADKGPTRTSLLFDKNK